MSHRNDAGTSQFRLFGFRNMMRNRVRKGERRFWKMKKKIFRNPHDVIFFYRIKYINFIHDYDSCIVMSLQTSNHSSYFFLNHMEAENEKVFRKISYSGQNSIQNFSTVESEEKLQTDKKNL